MIKNVLIDLDDTVFDFKKGERAALTEALSVYGEAPTPERLELYHRINDRHWKMLERGEISKEELNPARFRAFFKETGIDAPAEEFCLIYEKNLADKYFFMPGAEDALKTLSGRYRLYAASNRYVATQRNRLKLSGADKNFTGVFISEEVGYDKPAEEFFEKCFSEIPGFKKEETVIVGDSPTSDIKGGRDAGIKTVWFNTGEAEITGVNADYTARSFDEVIDILDII